MEIGKWLLAPQVALQDAESGRSTRKLVSYQVTLAVFLLCDGVLLGLHFGNVLFVGEDTYSISGWSIVRMVTKGLEGVI